MELYEDTSKGILIHTFTSIPYKIMAYRKKEMETIPKEKQIYYFATNQKTLFDSFYNGNNGIYAYKDLNYTKRHLFKQKETAKLDSYDNIPSEHSVYFDQPLDFIQRYELGLYDENKIKKVVSFDPEQNKYFLVAGKSTIFDDKRNRFSYEEEVKNGIYCVDGLISITKPLYLLQHILKKQYDKVKDENIDEQLSLFEYLGVTPYKIYMDELIKYVGWTALSKEEVEKKLSSHQVVLQKIKGKN